MKSSSIGRSVLASMAVCLLSVSTIAGCGTKEDAQIVQNEKEKPPVAPVVVPVPPKPEKPQAPSLRVKDNLTNVHYMTTLVFNAETAKKEGTFATSVHTTGIQNTLQVINANAHRIQSARVLVDKKHQQAVDFCDDLNTPLQPALKKFFHSSKLIALNIQTPVLLDPTPVLIQNCKPEHDTAWNNKLNILPEGVLTNR